jgi:predicted enzyme related to lactoylglutathione lyase
MPVMPVRHPYRPLGGARSGPRRIGELWDISISSVRGSRLGCRSVSNVLHTAICFEFWVTDVERAKAFYGELFGWTFRPMAEYHPDYWLVDAGEDRGTIGALRPTDVAPTDSGAIVYIAVSDLPDAIARAEHLGGTRPGTDRRW